MQQCEPGMQDPRLKKSEKYIKIMSRKYSEKHTVKLWFLDRCTATSKVKVRIVMNHYYFDMSVKNRLVTNNKSQRKLSKFNNNEIGHLSK